MGKTHEFQSSFSHEKTKHVILEEEEETHDRTGTPVVCPQTGAMPQQFILGDDETELELSLGSRSFLDRVNDQVRKRQKRSSMNVTENDEKHSVILQEWKRRKTGAKCAVHKDEHCFLLGSDLSSRRLCEERNVTVMSTVTGCDVTTVQLHNTG